MLHGTLYFYLLLASAMSAPATAPASGPATDDGWVRSAREYGVRGDGESDDTAALQRAIDAAAVQGGVIELPSGRYRINTSLIVRDGVALRGVLPSPQSITPLAGSVITAYGGRGQEDGPALFRLGNGSSVSGLTVWYPEQKPTEIVPYPWSFQLEGLDQTVENVTLINSYQGIRTGPGGNVRHRIRSVMGCVLRRGILVDACTDIGRIENCQFHCHFWSHPATGGQWDPVFKYMVENLETFTLGRTDWEYLTNNFVFPAKVGYRFIQTAQGACNGHLTGCGADACETSILIEHLQPMGLLITGGQFVAFTGKDPVQVRVADTCNASVRFVNCAFWGPARHNAILKGQGFHSFSDCYFSNWNKDATDWPLLIAEAGRLQINNSTFTTGQPSVQLGPQVKHAIIQGNNGGAGVRVISAMPADRLILANNEGYASEK